ncbi:MAG: D-alanine--D-alanine ligase [Phycisphaerales bacterium]|nr:D-alanine--D-alanine ligase [Phycisphaerales bacterium]
MTRVLVLGGGPDAEREVSIASAGGVHQGCMDAGLDATLLIVDTPSVEEIRAWDTDVIFPVLHGKFGEGGELQNRLHQAGRPFVGSGFYASSMAMDKLATKLIAAGLGIPTPCSCVLDAGLLRQNGALNPPIELPIVVKPVHDGSSMGLHICRSNEQWQSALEQVAADIIKHPHRVYMIERYTPGRELTASVISNPDAPDQLMALPIVEIAPKEGVYDYQAKYVRNDTVYTVNPQIDPDAAIAIQEQARHICESLGVRHLARVDFLLQESGAWSMLEVNTMPGFTPTSLLPKAAGAIGLSMPMLCEHLVRCAQREDRAADTNRSPIAQG